MNKPATVERELEKRAEEARQRNIAQRLNAVMAEVDYIQKEKKQGMNYSIVSHDAVTAKVRPILQAHGVVYYPRDLHVNQSGNRTEAVFTVRFENIDDRSDFIDVATFGYGVDQQDKGPGKAMSYGVKYAILKVLGLETGDDPDTVQSKDADYQPDAYPGCITASQREQIEKEAERVGADKIKLAKYLGANSIAELPIGKFEDALEALKKKAQPKPDLKKQLEQSVEMANG